MLIACSKQISRLQRAGARSTRFRYTILIAADTAEEYALADALQGAQLRSVAAMLRVSLVCSDADLDAAAVQRGEVGHKSASLIKAYTDPVRTFAGSCPTCEVFAQKSAGPLTDFCLPR